MSMEIRAAQEGNAWSELAVLQDAQQKLSPSDVAQLRINYHLARRSNYVITSVARTALQTSDALGIKYPAPPPDPADGRCNVETEQARF